MSKYICPICGRDYDNPGALADCVSKCAAEFEKKNKELDAARTEVELALENLNNAINAYNKISTNDEYSVNLKLGIKKESKIGAKTSTIKHTCKSPSDLESLLNDAFSLHKNETKIKTKTIPDSPAIKAINDLINSTDLSDDPDIVKEFNELIDTYNKLSDKQNKSADNIIPTIVELFSINPERILNDFKDIFPKKN
jgi:hypothetical protein